MSIAQGIGAITGGLSGIGSATGSIASRLGLSLNYFQQLNTASFRGVEFKALSADSGFGRKLHLHEYPNRDTPWAEDLGRKSRRYNLVGFLVGDDVVSQRENMISAVEAAGTGSLVHPTLGLTIVSVIDFQVTEQWDRGRYFELRFSFVETGERLFPADTADSGYSITVAGLTLNTTAAASFAQKALAAVGNYAKSAEATVTAVATIYTTAQGLARDARNAFQAVSTLTGSYGRFVGSSSSTLSASNAAATSSTVADALSDAVTRRAAVDAAAGGLVAAGAALDSTSIASFTDATSDLMAAILANSVDPADALRTLSTLAAFEPAAPTTSSVIGDALADMQTATGALVRRAALAALANAASNYQPASQDDALSVRARVVTLIDDELDVAGDSEDDAAYAALRTLRSAVIQDLNARGAALPTLKTFTLKKSLPALVLANRLYRDPDRSDDLVAQAQPIHPLFMPTSFVALSE